MDVFALLVRPGASRAATASPGPPYTNTAHYEAPRSTGREWDSSVCVWAQVSGHMNPCVDLQMLNFMHVFFFHAIILQ